MSIGVQVPTKAGEGYCVPQSWSYRPLRAIQCGLAPVLCKSSKQSKLLSHLYSPKCTRFKMHVLLNNEMKSYPFLFHFLWTGITLLSHVHPVSTACTLVIWQPTVLLVITQAIMAW